jgi:N-acetylneuraminate synthase
MKLEEILTGNNEGVYLIAELGINHNGDLQIAKQLIDAAHGCGWDCVKLQKRTPSLCVPEHQKLQPKHTPWGDMTYLEYKEKMEFSKKEYDYIDSYCKEKPIDWTASVWDLPSLEFLLQYDIPFIKIPSAKMTDWELLEESCKTGKIVILSTGMSTMTEIDEAVKRASKYTKKLILLHTNSAYPSPMEDINLSVINTFQAFYGKIVGYSGHEFGLEPTIAAVVLGAKVVERHITLSHKMWGTDQAASLEVHAMFMLKNRINDVVISKGDGIRVVTEKELEISKKLRG